MEENIIVYDARIDLAEGIHPADKVIEALMKLKEGEKYKLITPFAPIPLMAKAEEFGFTSTNQKIGEREFHTLFSKA